MGLRKLERIDKWLLRAVCVAIIIVVCTNFATSFGHIYREALAYGENGFEAFLTPIGIDGMLLALGLANVFAGRFGRNHWLLRSALAFGVAGTVAANGAYGAAWGITGGLLATWSPVALFVAVESALFMFRIVADLMEQEAKKIEADATPKRGRPAGSRNKPKAPETPAEPVQPAPAQLTLPPVLKGRVDPLDPFQSIRDTGQFAAVK